MTDPCCEPAASMLSDGLNDAARELAVRGFEAVWAGRARDPVELLGRDPSVVAEVVDALVTRGRCEVDGDGRLVGIHGLTLRSTRHAFEHASTAHSTWCAFDSIGIPAALQIDAVAVTDCPACRSMIRLELRDGEPVQFDELALWLPDASGDHLMKSFCAAADLYCSRSHLEQCVGSADGEVADLARVLELGRATWADVAELDLGALPDAGGAV